MDVPMERYVYFFKQYTSAATLAGSPGRQTATDVRPATFHGAAAAGARRARRYRVFKRDGKCDKN